MRNKDVISLVRPCDVDFTDLSLRTMIDVKKKGQTLCTNLSACQTRSRAEGISCVRIFGQEMAGFVLTRMDQGMGRQAALRAETLDFIRDDHAIKVWTIRDGEWQVVENSSRVANEIRNFADTILGD